MLTEKDIKAYNAWYAAGLPKCAEYAGVSKARILWIYTKVPTLNFRPGYTDEYEPQETKAGMTSDPAQRKATPICTGVLDYFPDAIAEVAEVSLAGNKQHTFGPPLRWVRDRSVDHADSAVRHLMDRGTKDVDGRRHTAKAAWRILALLQLEIEADCANPSDPSVATVSSEQPE